LVIDEEGGNFALATSEHANETLVMRPESSFEAIWILRALTAEVTLDPQEVLEATGVELSVWQELISRIRAAHHTAIFFQESADESGSDYISIEALHALVKDLNEKSRVVCRSLGRMGNLTGAEQVLTWTTGYATSIDFSRGYPRFSPGEYSVDPLLQRGEVDAVLVSRQPAIVVHQLDRSNSAIAFATSLPGIDHGGTVYRVDGVPLPLRPFRKSHLPSEAEVLAKLLAALKSAS
jgi:formylmethanofuran dehydrogenase subunit B